MKKGYFVKGIFVAEGSELDLELQRERKAQTQSDPDKPSRTQMKAASEALQELGLQLMSLRDDLRASLDLPDSLLAAVDEYKRLTNREAKRRHIQYVGKLMRKLDEEGIAAIENSLKAQARAAPRVAKPI